MITQIVYYSISETEMNNVSISEILEPSRINNAKKGITGCLLYHNRVFLQLLEGEKETITDLYKIIQKDVRHSNVTLIIEESIDKRMYPGWSMAFHEFKNNSSNLDKFAQSIDFFSKNIPKKSEAIDLFWRMAKQIVN
ncbi:BLUF domain-containing protein [Polaribacter sp. R77954]|uniref:BLUF domain-containing protein n=1 Tax=Polaribacter sp. R77954 TaxID=3093870 RepID=UPI0037C76521